MAVGSRSRCRTAGPKRHSWPKTRVHHLETIPESPRSPPKKSFAFEIDSHLAQATQKELSDSIAENLNDEPESVIPEAIRAQMQWYSHHLAQSYRDRERLATRVSDLETVCKSQTKANTSLHKAVTLWQQNYRSIELELIEASHEIDEARASIRRLKTTNSNLRYTLCQLKEEREYIQDRKWSNRLRRSWQACISWSRSLLQNNSCTSSQQQTRERPPARQDFNDQSRMATPEYWSGSESSLQPKANIPSAVRRVEDADRPRPLSSHPPEKSLLDEEPTTPAETG